MTRFELVIKMERIAFSNDNEKFPRTRSIQNVGSNRTNFVVTRPFLAGGISDFNCLLGVIHKPCGHGRGEGGFAKCPYYYISLI